MMILHQRLRIKVLFSMLVLIFLAAGGAAQESSDKETAILSSPEREVLKKQIITAVTEEGVFRKDLFYRVSSGRPTTEVEAFAEDLLNNYINERLKKDRSPVPELHRFLFNFYPIEKLSILLTNLAKFSIFNAFSEALSDYLDNELESVGSPPAHAQAEKQPLLERGSGDAADLLRDLRFAVHTYKGLSLYKSEQEKTAEDWENIFGNLMKAWEARPLRIDAEALVEAAKNAKQKGALFELSAYFYYDRGEESFFRRTGLFFRYLFTPDKKGGFRKELQQVRRKLRRDILLAVEQETPVHMPAFEPATFFSFASGETVTFNAASPESPLFGKSLILSFFSTKCNHCLTELKALGQIQNKMKTSKQTPLFAAINTNLPSIETMKEEVPRYIEENKIEIPIYSNLPDRNALIMRYGITNVPLILLFDKTGTPLARVRFNHMGHVKLKLQWILEEYLHVDF